MAKGLPRSLKKQKGPANMAGFQVGIGVKAQQQGFQNLQKTVLRLTNLTVALTDNAGVIAYLGQEVFDFPEGLIMFHGAVANLVVTKSSAGVNANWAGNFSLGTVTANNNASLTSTEADLVPSTACSAASAGVGAANGKSGSSQAPQLLDGTSSAKKVFLNYLVNDTDHDVTTTPCSLIFNGTITLFWTNLGDI